MEELQNRSANSSTSVFTVKKVLSSAIDYWYLFIISLAICVTYAWFKVHYATPMFKVYAQVLIEDDKSGNGAAQALSGGGGGGMDFNTFFNDKTNIQNEIGILHTTDICRKVVDNMQLYISYYHKGSVRTVELYEGSPFKVIYKPDNNSVVPSSMELKFPSANSNSFTIQVGQSQIPWHFDDTLHFNHGSFYFVKTLKSPFDTKASYLLLVQDPESAAAGLSSNLTANQMGVKSTILNLEYVTNLPEKGIAVLSGIIQAYIDRNLNEKNLSSDSTIQFINSRIALVGSELGGIETTIQQFKQSNKIADLEAQSQQLVANSSSYFQQLNELEVQLQVIKTMLAYVEDEQNNHRPVPALLNTDATFSGLVVNYNSAQVQRDKLLLSVKVDNPIVKNLDVQIAGMRGDIIRSLKSQQEALTISRQKLTSQNTQLNSQIYNVPQQERKFLDYSREQSIKQALYLFLLQRREEIAIARAANAPNASVIQAPKANYIPFEPNTNSTLITGVVLGLLLPFAFIVLKLLLNNRISSREDIASATPATIIAEIGHSSSDGLLNIQDEGRSVIAEQFRIFRTNMDFTLPDKNKPTILITSGASGEGKSFITANLGQIYAISGKKVLLIELDMRKPKLSKMLGVDNSIGFSSYIISQDTPFSNYIQPVGDTGSLYILPSGPIPPNPAELLLSARTAFLMAELKKQFDIILIDTAPIGAVTDAQIIGRYADVSLYVIRQGFSMKNSIEVVNDILQHTKLPHFYLAVNDVKTGVSYKYGYGYGYQYGYGYGYTDKLKKGKKSRWKKASV